MAAPQPTGTPEPATPAAEPTPTLAAGDILDEIMSEPLEGETAPETPPETKPEPPPAPEPAGPILKLSDAELEKAIATPEGRKAALKSLRDAERANHDKFISLGKREGKVKAREANTKREQETFAAIRDEFMANVKIATSGTTEEALNALTRIRAGAGQPGADFLREAQLAAARNGKKPDADPELAAVKAELEKLKADKQKEKDEGQSAAEQEFAQRRHGEIASTVCDNPAHFPLAGELGQANRSTLHELAWGHILAQHRQGTPMSDADAARRVESDLQVLREFPTTLQYCRLGNLDRVVMAAAGLAQNEGLDERAAFSRIETQLRATFGAPPQGDAGRAPSAQAAPDAQAMPGKTPSARAANGGSTREPTNAEHLAQFDDFFEELGVN